LVFQARVPGGAVLLTGEYERGFPAYHLQDPVPFRELCKTDFDFLRILRCAGDGKGYVGPDVRVLVRERCVDYLETKTLRRP